MGDSVAKSDSGWMNLDKGPWLVTKSGQSSASAQIVTGAIAYGDRGDFATREDEASDADAIVA